MENWIKNLDNSYAIIEKDEQVMICSWKIHKLEGLDKLEQLQKETKKKIVFITPFCLARDEKWHDAIWEEKIIAMEVENEIITTREQILDILPDNEISLWDIETNVSDEDFWTLVSDAKEDIYAWNINQLILSRKSSTDINIDTETILSIYAKLLENRGQYMTFLFNTTDELFIWASPERHLQIQNSKVVMNPIAWTMWKWNKEDFYERFIDFLGDEKEICELAMVIDEELKMISKITKWWTIEWPLVKDVWAVIHSEVNLDWNIKEGTSMTDAFKETLYAPTLVWGPLESAFNLIEKYEGESRWYYWGAFWVLWEDFLDTCIVIRTAFINKLNSILSVRAWAWIVKDSVPERETNETVLKSNWFFWALKWKSANNSKSYLDWLSDDEKNNVNLLLEKRKSRLSSFYTSSHLHDNLEVEKIKWKKFILINNWDDFVFLSWFMIEKMWWVIDIVDNVYFDISQTDDYDVVLLWPWYWDINDQEDQKMLKLLDVTEKLIKDDKKILWICLGHQAICKTKWYEIKRQQDITQWEQLEVEMNWKRETLWFYNSFSPVIKWDDTNIDKFASDRVLNYREPNISSTQSHPESIMSINWFEVLKNMILELV